MPLFPVTQSTDFQDPSHALPSLLATGVLDTHVLVIPRGNGVAPGVAPTAPEMLAAAGVAYVDRVGDVAVVAFPNGKTEYWRNNGAGWGVTSVHTIYDIPTLNNTAGDLALAAGWQIGDLARIYKDAAQLTMGVYRVEDQGGGQLGFTEVQLTAGGGTTSPAVSQYTHTQAVPALTWNVSHNLNGIIDSVNIYVGGQKVTANINIEDANNLTISFGIARVGYAIIEL